MTQILFGVISILGVLAALGTVLARNIVHAALHLVAFFFIVACQFILLEAEFLAAVQVLVYIGAVAILLMFGIMLTRNILGDDTTITPLPVKQASILVTIGVVAVLILGISKQEVGASGRKPWSEVTKRPGIGPDPALRQTPKAVAVNQMAKVVGNELLTRYVIAFEVAGVLLTAALVGAIALAQEEGDDDPSIRGRAEHLPAGAATGFAHAPTAPEQLTLTSSSTR